MKKPSQGGPDLTNNELGTSLNPAKTEGQGQRNPPVGDRLDLQCHAGRSGAVLGGRYGRLSNQADPPAVTRHTPGRLRGETHDR